MSGVKFRVIDQMPLVLFGSFPKSVGKNETKRSPSCEKQVSSSLSQHSVSRNTNIVADESLHRFCPIALQQHQEILWRKQEKNPSVERQPSVLVFFFLKVICFSLRNHSHSVYYTESKCICPSLCLCLVVCHFPLTATQLLRKCPGKCWKCWNEISCSLHLLATIFHVPCCCLPGYTFFLQDVMFFSYLLLTGWYCWEKKILKQVKLKKYNPGLKWESMH